MPKKSYQVVIVGAGPAGLFASYELSKQGLTDVLLVDRGKRAEHRNAKTDILFGVGGAGLHSDGKLNFVARRGKTDLTEFLPLTEAEALVDYLENVFAEFGMEGATYPSSMDEAQALQARAKRLGMNLLLVRQKHMGSDRLPAYIEGMERFLEARGITLLTETAVLKVEADEGRGTIVTDSQGEIACRYLLLAPGRSGNQWLADRMEELGADVEYQPIEVGVRVEVASEILQGITNVMYDPAIFLFSHSYDDQLRTFCTNPAGYVVREEYKEFVCVNGHAYKSRQSANSNFALLNKISLSEPITDTIAYGESIAKLANTIGGGKPLLQRFLDFKRFRRSTWGRLDKSYVEPTMTDVTPGDIAMALPHRVVVNLIEGLERLDGLIPGIASDATLLYAPEVKFHSCRPQIDRHLETQVPNVFLAGDGAGVSGNIVGAAATGVIAARRILEREDRK